MPKKIAIIDLGSNSIRLALMQISSKGSFKLLDELKETARIVENMGPERLIKEAALVRAIQTIKLLVCFADANKADKILGVATAALRLAANGRETLAAIYKETGLAFRILSGEEEARYEYLGVVNTLAFNDALIMDIGGGSTELILCKNRRMMQWESLSMGAVTITESFFPGGCGQPHEVSRLEEYLFDCFSAVPWLNQSRGLEVIGVGGTYRNLGGIDRKAGNYSLNVTHDYRLDSARALQIYSDLQNKSVEERKSVPGLSKDRADIILGGLAVVAAILKYIGAPQVRISGCGLREGIFYEYLLKSHKYPVIDDVIEHSVQNFINQYKIKRRHAGHVARLSLSLFDQLIPIHGYGDWERGLLRIAALLHDAGSIISYYHHHRHTLYILLNNIIRGLTHRENVIVALVASYHGKLDLKSLLRKHADVLAPGDGMLVRKLGLLLRMAESLDKSEAGLIKDVCCTLLEQHIEIKCHSRENAQLEIRDLYKKVTSFNKVFGKRFLFLREGT